MDSQFSNNTDLDNFRVFPTPAICDSSSAVIEIGTARVSRINGW